MGFWGTASIVAASVVGSALSNKASKKAAKSAQFKPSNVTGPSGTSNFTYDRASKRYNLSLLPSDTDGMMRNRLTDRALSGINGGQYSSLAGDMQEQSGGTIGNLFSDFQNIDTFGGESGLDTAGRLSDLSDVATGGMQGAFAQLGQSPSGMGLINDMQQRAGSMMDMSGTPSFNQLAAERLSTLRGLSRPTEERLVNSKFSDLHSQGRLGTTGGSQILGDLSQALGREDMMRITASQDFAQNQSNIERDFSLNRAGMGSNLFGMALQGIGQEQGNSMNFGGLGVDLLGAASQSSAGSHEATLSSDDARLSRGQTRLASAQGLFGFGDQLRGTELDRGLQSLGGAQTIDQTLMDQARIGGSIGQSQATAGANAASMRGGSTLGAALTGLSAGISNGGGSNGSSLSNLFSGLGRRNTASQAPMGSAGATSYSNPNLWNGSKTGGR